MKRPKNWRTGQTIFNFLAWVKKEDKYQTAAEESHAMIDPYYIPDETWDELYAEYMRFVAGITSGRE